MATLPKPILLYSSPALSTVHIKANTVRTASVLDNFLNRTSHARLCGGEGLSNDWSVHICFLSVRGGEPATCRFRYTYIILTASDRCQVQTAFFFCGFSQSFLKPFVGGHSGGRPKVPSEEGILSHFTLSSISFSRLMTSGERSLIT